MSKVILFVCNGNIHRSVIAALSTARLLNERGLDGEYEVLSRGLQGTMGTSLPRHRNLREYAHEWAQSGPPLAEIGLDIPKGQQSTPITRQVAELASAIFAMDNLVLSTKPNSLANQFPDLRTKMHLFGEIAGTLDDVPDPAGKDDPSLHRDVVHTIDSTLRQHLDTLLQFANA